MPAILCRCCYWEILFLFYYRFEQCDACNGYPKKAMLSSLLTVGVNIILAPIFIFHLDWGIRGAATATILAQMGGLAWVLTIFYIVPATSIFERVLPLEKTCHHEYFLDRNGSLSPECVCQWDSDRSES